jgi:hypothetical protein
MKQGQPQESHFELAEKYLESFRYLWKQANLSFTPKIHSLPNRAVEQIRKENSIGDTLEDET